MLLLAIGVALLDVVRTYGQHTSINGADLVRAAAWAVGVLLTMPLILALTAKTEQRVLELAPDGIRTTIGPKAGIIPWSKVSFVGDTDAFVMISRTNANYFIVPRRAFLNADARARFVAEARTRATGSAEVTSQERTKHQGSITKSHATDQPPPTRDGGAA